MQYSAFLSLAHLALRNVLRQRRRSAITMLAVVFGVIAMMLTDGFIEWIFWSMREGTAIPQLGHIQVVKRGYYRDGQADPLAYLIPKQPAGLASIKKTSMGVRSISPRLYVNGLISLGDNTLTFLAIGIDPALDPSLHNLLVIEGSKLKPEVPAGILVGIGLAANLGAKVDDQVVLLSNTASGGLNAIEARIIGLASTSYKAYDDSYIWMPVDLARKLVRVGQGAHIWVVSLDKTENTDVTLQRLNSEAVVHEYELIPWYLLADHYNKTVQLLTNQIDIVRLIIATIILIGITNTMTMNVMERTVEIGTAMALGARRRRIVGLFMLEAIVLGTAGWAVGVILGFALADLISYIGIPMPPGPGMSRGYTAAVIVTASSVVNAFLLALITTWLASLYPAWRASHLVIVEALRRNR